MKQLTFMKNRIVFLMIYTENKNAVSSNYIIHTSSIIKYMCLRNPSVASGQSRRFSEHSLSTTVIKARPRAAGLKNRWAGKANCSVQARQTLV